MFTCLYRIGLASLILFVVGCQAQPRLSVLPQLPLSSSEEEDEFDDPGSRAEAKKLEKLISVTLEKAPLGETLETIRKATDVNLFVNWEALKAVNIDQEKMITLKAHDVPARYILDLVLSDATSDDTNPVTWRIRQGILHISTEKHLSDATVRCYDVHDLLLDLPTSGHKILWEIPASTQPNEQNQQPYQRSRDEKIKDLDTILMWLIEWPVRVYASGGTWNSALEWNGVAIYFQTPEGHLKTRKALDDLLAKLQAHTVRMLQHEEVVPLLERADALRLQGDYAGALKIVAQAQAVAPDHPWVRAMVEVLNGTISRQPK